MNKIIDLFGRRASPGLVDASGNQISSEPSANGNGAASPAAAGPAAASQKGQFIPTGKLEIKGILIACLCSDGTFRHVALSNKEAGKVTKIIKRMHGGNIRLKEKPVLVVRELVMKPREDKASTKGNEGNGK